MCFSQAAFHIWLCATGISIGLTIGLIYIGFIAMVCK